MPGRSKKNIDATTEEKIKEAARKIFTQERLLRNTRTRRYRGGSRIKPGSLKLLFSEARKNYLTLSCLETLQQFMNGHESSA